MRALLLASNQPEHVFILSIPDYTYTPLGAGSISVSSQIDQFNAINKQIYRSGIFLCLYLLFFSLLISSLNYPPSHNKLRHDKYPG